MKTTIEKLGVDLSGLTLERVHPAYAQARTKLQSIEARLAKSTAELSDLEAQLRAQEQIAQGERVRKILDGADPEQVQRIVPKDLAKAKEALDRRRGEIKDLESATEVLRNRVDQELEAAKDALRAEGLKLHERLIPRLRSAEAHLLELAELEERLASQLAAEIGATVIDHHASVVPVDELRHRVAGNYVSFR